eukprot:Plantae.Rhodophyta-Hildenbrandia_rubra.ctg1460.p2 GENE.Plantae.Rhodophyta-Hildenbrandia_rubra.ctg1460~~Plantae.Rhodophyta-Hildenbrandia_rubra.ctg1460.p2  ORF type:complete len:163 (+),score=33.50 Plantae.Rhodophyta-Hildenbrandia_rubra.ctg1460:526-1014(+)
MPPSMRRQRAAVKRRGARGQKQKELRELAAAEFQASPSSTIRGVSESLGLSRGATQSMRLAAEKNDTESLSKLLSPLESRAGRKAALSSEGEGMLSKAIARLGKSEAASSALKVRSLMGKAAADGRVNACEGCAPSEQALRAFRARRLELASREAESKTRKN